MLREPYYCLSDLPLADHMHEENEMFLLTKYNRLYTNVAYMSAYLECVLFLLFPVE